MNTANRDEPKEHTIGAGNNTINISIFLLEIQNLLIIKLKL